MAPVDRGVHPWAGVVVPGGHLVTQRPEVIQQAYGELPINVQPALPKLSLLPIQRGAWRSLPPPPTTQVPGRKVPGGLQGLELWL